MLCDECGCLLQQIGDDNKGECYEEVLLCGKCGKRYLHLTEFDQNGLVLSDDLSVMRVDE